MSIKKSVAATVVAVGLTVTATGSYASSASEAGGASEAVKAQRVTERAAVNEQQAQTAAADRTDSRSDAAKRKCVGKKKIKKLRAFQKYKKVMKRLPKATYKNKSGGLRFRSFNACTSSLDTDLDLVFKKLKKKWRVYQVSVFWS